MKFEVIRTEAGRYHWRLRDEDGTFVRFLPGSIALPPDPEADERSRQAVQDVLRQQYEADRASGA